MLSRLINGLIAGLIAWSVTHSEWIALVVFGATAGLSSNKFKWAEEIVKTIKEEAGKAKDASSTSSNQQKISGMQSAAAKIAASLTAKVATNTTPKHAAPAMLKHKNDTPGYAPRRPDCNE